MTDADILGGGYSPPPLIPPSPRLTEGKGGVAGILLALFALVCLTAVGVSGIQIARELRRGPTKAERAQAASVELARRWQAWPAGKIFPPTLGYALDVAGDETAMRVGIDTGESCAGGLDAAALKVLARYHCRAVLRATYLDELQGVVITVGVIAFPGEQSASLARAALPGDDAVSPGLRALGLRASVSARFNDAGRQLATSRQQGPYVVSATVGYVDGRPATATKERQSNLYLLAQQLSAEVLRSLGRPVGPDCTAAGWRC